MRTVYLISLVAAVCWLFGCSGSESLSPIVERVPIFHSSPTWIDSENIAFRNSGIIEYGAGWANVDLSQCGIFVWNVNSGDFKLVVQNGDEVNSPNNGGDYLCSVGPDMYLANGDTIYDVVEPEIWPGRFQFSLSSSGQYISWNSFGNEFDNGIWIFDRNSGDYNYLGSGWNPNWKPGELFLVYKTQEFGNGFQLVGYELASGETRIIYQFAVGMSCRDFCFSPDGSSLAYSGVSTSPGEDGIYVLDLSSGSTVRLTAMKGHELSWGDTGIVFVNACSEAEDSGCGVLFFVDPESGGVQRLTERMQFID